MNDGGKQQRCTALLHETEVVEVPRRAGDPSVVVAASEKIRAEFGWVPERPELAAMISEAWAWMRVYSHVRGLEPRLWLKGGV